MSRPTIVFDVNETLLDLRGLDAPFTAIFGSVEARADWFKQLLQLSPLANTLDDYADFSALSRRALGMVAAQRGHALRDDERRRSRPQSARLRRIPTPLRRLHVCATPAFAWPR